jgi:hypothetical protein
VGQFSSQTKAARGPGAHNRRDRSPCIGKPDGGENQESGGRFGAILQAAPWALGPACAKPKRLRFGGGRSSPRDSHIFGGFDGRYTAPLSSRGQALPDSHISCWRELPSPLPAVVPAFIAGTHCPGRSFGHRQRGFHDCGRLGCKHRTVLPRAGANGSRGQAPGRQLKVWHGVEPSSLQTIPSIGFFNGAGENWTGTGLCALMASAFIPGTRSWRAIRSFRSSAMP